MKDSYNIIIKVILLQLSIGLVLFCGCSDSTQSDHEMSITEVIKPDTRQNIEISVSPPPFSEDIFPCSECHDAEWETNQERRVLDMHEEIVESFDHDSENRWCLDCHNVDDRDYLKLASGKLVSYEESYMLCGQCHGDKLRDWRVGVHGKRTGEWNGKKEYLLCAHCHNPHSPKFKSLKPLPPPDDQKDIF